LDATNTKKSNVKKVLKKVVEEEEGLCMKTIEDTINGTLDE